MANYSNTSRPAYVWDGVNNQWVPVGVGPHTHSVADVANAVSNLGGSNIANTTATSVPLTLTGAVSQTADLLDVKNSAGTVVANIDANGNFAAQNANYAGKNKIINGDFGIWQRGTSVGTSSNNIYWADRWSNSNGGGNAITTSRQSSGLTGLQYCARIQRNSGTSNTNGIYITHSIETANSIPLAGKTVTFSFYARAGANFSASGSSMVYAVQSGTGTDESISVGYTGSSTLVSNTVTLTTSWQRFTATASVGSTATELGVYFGFTPTGTAGTNDYFELTGVQLEVGSVATPFTTASGTLQGELAACQRYYYRNSANGNANAFFDGTVIAVSSTNFVVNARMPVTMRTSPSSLDYSGIAVYDLAASSPISVTSLSVNQGNPNTPYLYGAVSSGLSTSKFYMLFANGSSNYIGWSAEL